MAGLLSKLKEAIRSFFGNAVSEETSLRANAREMLQTLEMQANAASFAMARADEARKALQSEVDNHESLKREAEQFLIQGDEVAARRLVTLQLQSAEKVNQLTSEYQSLQRDAERKVLDFKKNEDEVNKRVKALPKIEQDLHLMREEERLQKALSKYQLENPKTEFDQVQHEIEIKRKQIENRNLLTADPNAELDRKIQEAIGQRKIDDALEALKSRVKDKSVIDAEFTEAGAGALSEAQKALEAPRFQSLQLPGSAADKAEVPAKKDNI